MTSEGLGGLARRWVKAKVKEVTTADRRTREAAAYEADETGRQLRDDAVGETLMHAIPGLGRWRDSQRAAAERAETERLQRRDDELARRPLASVTVRVRGALAGAWSGALPTTIAVAPANGSSDDDPFDGAPTLEVDVAPRSASRPTMAGLPFDGWRFQIPGFGGPGSYDLAASGLARRDAGAEPDYLDWYFALGPEGFFFQPDVGPSTVEVTGMPGVPGRMVVHLSLVGAAGALALDAEIEWPGRGERSAGGAHTVGALDDDAGRELGGLRPRLP